MLKDIVSFLYRKSGRTYIATDFKVEKKSQYQMLYITKLYTIELDVDYDTQKGYVGLHWKHLRITPQNMIIEKQEFEEIVSNIKTALNQMDPSYQLEVFYDQ